MCSLLNAYRLDEKKKQNPKLNVHFAQLNRKNEEVTDLSKKPIGASEISFFFMNFAETEEIIVIRGF